MMGRTEWRRSFEKQRLRMAVWAGLLVLPSLTGCVRRGSSGHITSPGMRAHASLREFPDLGKGQEIEPGVMFHEVRLPRGAASSRLWVYVPKEMPRARRPCVLVGPAGTRLFHGIALGEGDRPEHLPYVRAGFPVVAYDIDGALPGNAGEPELIAAARAFKEAGAGWINAHEALDYALGKVPAVDPYRIVTAGHSSAATLSLLTAEREMRVSGCIAYAPIYDVVDFLGERVVDPLSRAMPGFRQFLVDSSPQTHVARLRCPVFLFHSEEDTTVPISKSAAFVEQLRKTNRSVTFVRAPSGDHYQSMIRQGIPQAIEWLKQLSTKR
jgi:pimeloyl-ACP methyl ester carboxylesterase